MNGAESLMQTLSGAGVEICFTNPGTTEMHLLAALDQVPAMQAVLVFLKASAPGRPTGMRG